MLQWNCEISDFVKLLKIEVNSYSYFVSLGIPEFQQSNEIFQEVTQSETLTF